MKKHLKPFSQILLIFVLVQFLQGTHLLSQTSIDSSMVEFDSLGNPMMMRGQIIVKFVDNAFIPSALFDSALPSGAFSDFIQPMVADSVSAVSHVTFYSAGRMIPQLDPTIMYSISRAGDTIPMPKFRNVLILYYDGLERADSIANRLNRLNDYIHYAEPVAIGGPQWVPNDPNYSQQKSLHTGINFHNFNCQMSQGEIKMEAAWDIEKGKEFVRVGIYDTGVDWMHPDFGNGTMQDNVVKGGWDYARNTPLNPVWPMPGTNLIYGPEYYHGTVMAGIIGARSNNGFGTAGVVRVAIIQAEFQNRGFHCFQ